VTQATAVCSLRALKNLRNFSQTKKSLIGIREATRTLDKVSLLIRSLPFLTLVSRWRVPGEKSAPLASLQLSIRLAIAP
jgi:hypothetical protein